MKRPSAVTQTCKAGTKSGCKKMTQQKVAECVRDMIPIRRTAYALFVKEQYPLYQASQNGGGQQEQRQQRSIIKNVAAAWRDLTEDQRAVYQREADEEFQAQCKAKASVFHEDSGPNCENPAPRPVSLGSWQLVSPGEVLWSCGNAEAFLVQHKVLRMRAMATVYSQAIDYSHEFRVLQKLSKESSASIPFDLFLLEIELTSPSNPLRYVIQPWLPTLQEYKDKGDQINGAKLAAYTTSAFFI